MPLGLPLRRGEVSHGGSLPGVAARRSQRGLTPASSRHARRRRPRAWPVPGVVDVRLRGNPSAASSRSRSSSAGPPAHALPARRDRAARPGGWPGAARARPRRGSSLDARCAGRAAPLRGPLLMASATLGTSALAASGSAASGTLTLRSMAAASSGAGLQGVPPLRTSSATSTRALGDVEEGLQVLCGNEGTGRCSDPGDLGERPELRRPRGVLGHEPVTGETTNHPPPGWSRPGGSGSRVTRPSARWGHPGGATAEPGSMICPSGSPRPGLGSASHDTSMRARSASRWRAGPWKPGSRRARSCSSRSRAGPSAGGAPARGGSSPTRRWGPMLRETGGEGLGAHVSLLPDTGRHGPEGQRYRVARRRGCRPRRGSGTE